MVKRRKLIGTHKKGKVTMLVRSEEFFGFWVVFLFEGLESVVSLAGEFEIDFDSAQFDLWTNGGGKRVDEKLGKVDSMVGFEEVFAKSVFEVR